MKIELDEKEVNILKNYQSFLWKMNKTSFKLREILHIILDENSEELKMMLRDLKIDSVKRKD